MLSLQGCHSTHTATNFTLVFLKTPKFSCIQPVTANRYPPSDLLEAHLLSFSPLAFCSWLILICFITGRHHDRIERTRDLELKKNKQNMNCSSALNLLAAWRSASRLSSRTQGFSFERGLGLEVCVKNPCAQSLPPKGWGRVRVSSGHLIESCFFHQASWSSCSRTSTGWALPLEAQNETTALTNETLSQTEHKANQSSLPLAQNGSKT